MHCRFLSPVQGQGGSVGPCPGRSHTHKITCACYDQNNSQKGILFLAGFSVGCCINLTIPPNQSEAFAFCPSQARVTLQVCSVLSLLCVKRMEEMCTCFLTGTPCCRGNHHLQPYSDQWQNLHIQGEVKGKLAHFQQGQAWLLATGPAAVQDVHMSK